MSNQDSDQAKPIGRFARLLSATQKSSGDSGFAKKQESENEQKSSGIGGRGRFLQMAVSYLFYFSFPFFFFNFGSFLTIIATNMNFLCMSSNDFFLFFNCV